MRNGTHDKERPSPDYSGDEAILKVFDEALPPFRLQEKFPLAELKQGFSFTLSR